MSLFGSLFSGVSGLTAQSQAMGMISDNVANVNTVSYKGAAPKFSTLVTRSAAVSTYSPGGARANTLYRIDQQGLLQGSNSPTDVAIDGAGFFVVNSRPDGSGDQLYTRAGSFEQDFLGNLRNNAGFYLQGWGLDASEQVININQLSTVNVRVINGVAAATTNVELGANLDARQTPFAGAYVAGDLAAFNATGGVAGAQPHMVRAVQVFDPLGGAHNLHMAFLKDAAANTWNVEVYADPAEVEAGSHPNGLLRAAPSRLMAMARSRAPTLRPTTRRPWPAAPSASTGWMPAGRTTARSRSISAPSAPPTASASSRATTTSRL
jgi:flagellar hook protein FlgE